MTVLHWFRRDLRLMDNTALNAALRSGEQVVPLFIFDPALLARSRTGTPRLALMLAALRALDQALRAQGGRLLVRQGDPAVIVPQVAYTMGAQAVYANCDYTPYARRRDAAVERVLSLPRYMFHDAVLRAPGQVMKGDGQPYVVYTPFKRQWRILPAPARPETVQQHTGAFYSHELPGNLGVLSLSDLGRAPTLDLPPVSEEHAQRRLDTFTSGPIYEYAESRNRLACAPLVEYESAGTATLSPYLRFGVISPRQVYWAGQEACAVASDDVARESVETWIDELIWREFYVHILYHFPYVLAHNFRPEYDALIWRDAPDEFAAWQTGRTGYPIVDAAMRQLMQIGWMPNRARMIVASFLTKDLLIDWRAGERHFMQWLIDGDPAANNGGWQWAAGTGTDAQPYFRIFNPVAQSEKFDPNGDYIRCWVPELRDVPTRYIHAPWTMPTPPAEYPPPIVDHAEARERTLAAFKAARE